jgi:hypothetical protein
MSFCMTASLVKTRHRPSVETKRAKVLRLKAATA